MASQTYVSLPSLSTIAAYLPDGVPLAFVAASPVARLAAETYRCNENLVWTANGIVPRESGDRENFYVYEARRERRAGVRIGALIVVFHDSTGQLRPLQGLDPIRQEYCGKDPFYATWNANELAGSRRQALSPTGGNAKWSAALKGTLPRSGGMAAELLLQDGRLRFYQGPNRRSIYLWMDGVRRAFDVDSYPETNPVGALQELLDVTQWWLRRPPVSSMKYWHEVYSEKSNILPPVPPQLYMHLYGEHSCAIQSVCQAFLQGGAEECPEAGAAVGKPRSEKDKSLDALFGGPSARHTNGRRREPKPCQQSSPSKDDLSSHRGIPAPVMEGLFVTSHPQMKMSLLEQDAVPPLPSHMIANLKLFKLNALSVDDNGLQRFLQHSGKKDVKGSAAASRTAVVGASSVAAPFTNTPFLQVCDVAFNAGLTIFPLIHRADSARAAASGLQCESSLRNLTMLNLQCTSVDDDVMAVIGMHCVALQHLYVGSCQHITTLNPIATLPKLWFLDAHATAITDDGIASLGKNQSLEEVCLSGCTALHDVTPLAYVDSLRKLDLRDVLVRTGMDILRGCPRLEELLLSEYSNSREAVPGYGPPPAPASYLIHLQSLSHLAISEMPFFTEDALEALVRSRAPVTVLHLIHVPGLQSVNALAGMDSLVTLYINGAEQLTKKSIQGLGQCKQLEQCTIHACRALTNFNTLADAPRLQYLDVTRNGEDLQPNDLARFAKASSPLETLLLSQYQKVDHVAFVSGLPHLREIDLSSTNVSTEGLEPLALAQNLETVYCNFCPMVTKVSALADIVSLTKLDLTGTGVTDHGIGSLPSARSLEVLILGSCSALRFLSPMEAFPSLKVLSLLGNTHVADRALQSFFRLAEFCPAVKESGNPLMTPFPVLEELDLCGCPITTIYPLLQLPALRSLCLRATRVNNEGLVHLQDIPTLTSLDVQTVSTLTDLQSLFIHPALRQLDIRGMALTTTTPAGKDGKSQQPVSLPSALLLSDTPLFELKMTGSVDVLRLMWPVLCEHHAGLPQLSRLLLSGAMTEELQQCIERLQKIRPLLSVLRV